LELLRRTAITVELKRASSWQDMLLTMQTVSGPMISSGSSITSTIKEAIRPSNKEYLIRQELKLRRCIRSARSASIWSKKPRRKETLKKSNTTKTRPISTVKTMRSNST